MIPTTTTDLGADEPLRILAIGEAWQGSNSYAFFRSFRRSGHSVSILTVEGYAAAGWTSTPLRLLRRLATPLAVRDFTAAIERETRWLRPHLLFVFKGHMVEPRAIRFVQKSGGVAINFWPDVSVMAHGALIPQALRVYDWVFTTKTFGVADMERQLGVKAASFIPHAFDPETHQPMRLAADDAALYNSDASFIGTWSPKKEVMLAHLARTNPGLRLRVWGAQWRNAKAAFAPGTLTDQYVLGAEYAKAICASKINIAILSEVRAGASSGDQITSRTFHIPAAGGFMLHERTEEVKEYFVEGQECAMFEGADELADKVRYYLSHETERERIALAGRQRCFTSGYSADDRARIILAKAREILATRRARSTEPR